MRILTGFDIELVLGPFELLDGGVQRMFDGGGRSEPDVLGVGGDARARGFGAEVGGPLLVGGAVSDDGVVDVGETLLFEVVAEGVDKGHDQLLHHLFVGGDLLDDQDDVSGLLGRLHGHVVVDSQGGTSDSARSCSNKLRGCLENPPENCLEIMLCAVRKKTNFLKQFHLKEFRKQ